MLQYNKKDEDKIYVFLFIPLHWCVLTLGGGDGGRLERGRM